MQRYLIIVLVVLVFASFLTMDTVRFTENAVVSTLGSADGDKSVQTEPGLKFKIPFVQKITKYDTRQRIMQSRLEPFQTRDQSQIMVGAFMTWRVSNPLSFYRRFSSAGDRVESHYTAAEEILKVQLRSAMSRVSGYALDELLAPDGESKLGELETSLLTTLQRGRADDDSLSAIGIEVVSVGISRMQFPEATSAEVFNRMKTSRERIAQSAISRGSSIANTIRASAESDARRILTFADRRAAIIQARGDSEAAQFLAQMTDEPELAVFLEKLHFWSESLGKRVTLVFSTDMFGFDVLDPNNAGAALTNRSTATPAGEPAVPVLSGAEGDQ